MNTLQVGGVVLSIARIGDGKSAKIVVQHNVRRASRPNAPRQFINAVELRVPEKSIKQLEGITVGMVVQILGRVQGILSCVPGSPQTMYNELVASRIEPWRLIGELYPVTSPGGDSDSSPGGESEDSPD